MAYMGLSREWHWEPMLVAETILNKNNIPCIILGSAAIHHHEVRAKDDAPRASPVPWNFANTFEIGIPNQDISKAVELLCKDGLFKKQDDENYDTMYEGTSLHTKLQSTWNMSKTVSFILLPTEEYYVAGHPLLPRQKPCSCKDELAFAEANQLVLSLLHRKLGHKDHTAGRALDRIDHRYLFGLPGVKPPANWDDDLREKATTWLDERKLLLKEIATKPGFGSQRNGGIFGTASPQPEEKTPAPRGLFEPGPPAVDFRQKRKAHDEEDGYGFRLGVTEVYL